MERKTFSQIKTPASPTTKTSERNRAEKEKRLTEIKKEFSLDEFAKTIDKKILESVIIFTALGYRTRESCEGHAENVNRFPFPFITFSGNEKDQKKYREKENELEEIYFINRRKPSPVDFTKLKDLSSIREKVHGERKEVARKIELLLKEFYEKKGSKGFDYGISCDRHWDFTPTLEPKIAIEMEEKSLREKNWKITEAINNMPSINVEYDNFNESQRKEFLEKSRAELQRITNFLKEKYLNE